MMDQRYPYVPIEDARRYIDGKVNVFGVVTSFGMGQRSRGTDYVSTLKIIDESYPEPGISVNCFAEVSSKLPHVRSIGDIISLRRVVMKMHEGDVYCVYNKKFSSFALFEGKTRSGLIDYERSTNYCASEHDNDFLSKLRTWLLDHPLEAVKEESLFLRRIRVDPPFNLVCKVLHVSETPQGDWMLFVWDGTDTSPAALQNDLQLERERPCALHVEELPLSVKDLCTFPPVGSVLRVSASKSFKEIPQLHGGSQWVKLQNMISRFHYGMWVGMLQTSSKIVLLSEDEGIVRHCLKTFHDRLATAEGHYPMTSSPSPSQITVKDCEPLAYSTLIGSLTHPEVTHKCICIVRVVAACPWNTEHLSPDTQHYRIRFTLEDPTARIHAYILGEDGVTIFGGYPTSDVLTSKMNELLGITDSDRDRNPPWVWCWLKSYYLDHRNPRGTQRYRIFATKAIG